MTLDEALAQLESLGNERVRKQNKNRGAGENQFGVMMGDIRKLAAKIKTDHALALQLWDTGNIDAQFLAVLILKPAKLSSAEVNRMTRSVTFVGVADWFTSYVIKKHPDKESLRAEWMQSDDPWAARAGWTLTAERISQSPDGIDLPALLDRIESEMPDASTQEQWTMNSALAGVGIHHAQHRARALAIGERLGIYRDYPVSKGCTSPFAPIWINEIVRRKG
ncbi:MAG: DNA alkylation repair protein [Gemmatimonadota bacterium]